MTRKKKSLKHLPLLGLIFVFLTSMNLFFYSPQHVYAVTQAVYYVSTLGSDSNTGDISHPFATIQKARDTIRSINSNMTGDIIVYIRGGQYFQTETINFGVSDSGTNGYNIIYKAYSGEEVVIDGGQKVSGWTQVSGSSQWKATVNLDRIRQLYVNGNRAQRARSAGIFSGSAWYNDTSDSTSDKDGIYVDSSTIGFYANPSDVEIHWEVEWKSMHHKVKEILDGGSGTRIISMQQPWFCWGRAGRDWTVVNYDSPFYIENAYELLDAPGEWYLNRVTNELYYWPVDGEDMSSAEVYAPVVEKLINISGDSSSAKVHHIQFTGITFEHATWLKPDEEGVAFVQAGQIETETVELFEQTLGNIYLLYASNIAFERNTFRHMGGNAICLDNGVLDTSVVGNYFCDISGSSISVGRAWEHVNGESHCPTEPIPPGQEICTNITVKNNLIRQTGVEFWGMPAVVGYIADSLEISHNDIADNRYTGISMGWGWNIIGTNCRNNKINYNRIDGVMLSKRDGGGIYTLGNQPDSEIIGNYIKNNMPNDKGCIYPDEGSAYFKIEDNVCENIPADCSWLFIWIDSCHDNTVDNNYTTSSNILNNGTNCTVTNTHYYPNADWPAEALDIINNSGLEESYKDLLNLPETSVDLAMNKTVNAGSSLENTSWGKSYAVDGKRTFIDCYSSPYDGSNYTSGYSSNPAKSNPDNNEWLEIDLGTNMDFNEIKLYPRLDKLSIAGNSANFPVDFSIQVKEDGGTYSTVRTVTGQVNPNGSPQTYYIGSQDARYIKINVTRLGTPVISEPGAYKLQLAEVEVYNRIYGQNLAYNKAISSSSSEENNGWYRINSVDGNRGTGWSSNSDLTSNHAEWITVDLGASYPVTDIDLYSNEYGFPEDFTIALSNDSTNWTQVVSKTNDPIQPDNEARHFTFYSHTARYVKIEGTSLRMNPNDLNRYRMQLQEICIFNADKTSTCTASLGFSQTQGKNNWYYQEKNGNAYIDMVWDNTNNRWNSSSLSNCIAANNWQHPDMNDSVRKWVAPSDGYIRITSLGNIRLGTTGGDGVIVSIMKNNSTLWGPQLVDNTVGINLVTDTYVNEGDSVYFIVNKNDSISYDTVTWDQIITYMPLIKGNYQAYQDFSRIQSRNQWIYQEKTGSSFSDMVWDSTSNRWAGSGICLIADHWQHPGTNESVRKWVAPVSGSISVSNFDYIRLGQNGGDGTITSIEKNGNVLWGPYLIADTTGLTFTTMNLDVTAGDEICFIVNRNTNETYDTTLWNPIIIYN